MLSSDTRVCTCPYRSVTHCTVAYNAYAGIMIGWQKITEEMAAVAAHGEEIFDVGWNHVHDYGLGILSDFGGVYLSSADNLCFRSTPPLCHLPARVHHNLIHNCSRYRRPRSNTLPRHFSVAYLDLTEICHTALVCS